MWDVVSTGLSMMPRNTGAGVGAVSLGLFESLGPLVVGGLANRLLARLARRSGGLVPRLHRAHSVTLLATVALIALLVVVLLTSLAPLPVMLAASFLLGTLFAAQLLLFAALLAVFVRERRQGATAG